MGRPVTLLELRTRALQAADMTTASAIQYMPVSEINSIINDEAAALHDLTTLAWEDYLAQTMPLTLIEGTTGYALPADFYKLRSLKYADDREEDLSAVVRFDGGNLTIPRDVHSGAVNLRYVPQYTYLMSDTDTLNPNIPTGWEAYIVYSAAARMRGKAGLDISYVQGKATDVGARIKQVCGQRQASGRKRVKDVRGASRLRGRD